MSNWTRTATAPSVSCYPRRVSERPDHRQKAPLPDSGVTQVIYNRFHRLHFFPNCAYGRSPSIVRVEVTGAIVKEPRLLELALPMADDAENAIYLGIVLIEFECPLNLVADWSSNS
jgi:hypothetical protein